MELDVRDVPNVQVVLLAGVGGSFGPMDTARPTPVYLSNINLSYKPYSYILSFVQFTTNTSVVLCNMLLITQ